MSSATLIQNRWAIGAEIFPDIEAESRQRAALLIGRTLLQSSVKVETIGASAEEHVTDHIKIKTLHSSLIGARDGIVEDDKLVDANIGTEVAERLFAAGHETNVELEVDEDNELVQNGIKLTDVSLNTMRYANHEGIMQDRSRSELNNGFFFNALHQNNILDESVAVVFSHTPTDEKVKDDYNFFENDALSIQLIKKLADGKYVIQTAFVAGKTHPEGERHDLAAVKQLALENGVDVMSEDTETMLSQVMIIPTDRVPLGVTSIVEQYDKAAGGTFYGEAKPQCDYEAYSTECKSRDFKVITSRIKKMLLQEAPGFMVPSDAVERLDYWSRKYCLEQALVDETIDSTAFGTIASGHLQDARIQYAQGNMFEANRIFKLAQKTDASGSCPFKKAVNKDGDINDIFGGENISENSDDETESSGEKKMTCPYCEEDTTGDPCGPITCKNCTASTTCSQSENEQRAKEYKLEQIRKQRESRARSLIKKSKETKNEQFAVAA